MSSRVRGAATAAALTLAVALAPLPAHAAPSIPPAASIPAAASIPPAAASISLAAGETALIRFRLADEAALRRLVAAGADLAARPRTTAGAVLADLVVDDAGLAALTRDGAVPVQLIQRGSDGAHRLAGAATRLAADTLAVRQAYWWTTGGKTF